MKIIFLVFVISLLYSYLLGKITVWFNPLSPFAITENNAKVMIPLNAVICFLATMFMSAASDNVYSYNQLAAFFFGNFIGIILGLRR